MYKCLIIPIFKRPCRPFRGLSFCKGQREFYLVPALSRWSLVGLVSQMAVELRIFLQALFQALNPDSSLPPLKVLSVWFQSTSSSLKQSSWNPLFRIKISSFFCETCRQTQPSNADEPIYTLPTHTTSLFQVARNPLDDFWITSYACSVDRLRTVQTSKEIKVKLELQLGLPKGWEGWLEFLGVSKLLASHLPNLRANAMSNRSWWCPLEMEPKIHEELWLMIHDLR